MVSLIDTLEEQGLVKRKPPPDDARSRSRSLTGPATCCPVLEGQSHAMEDEVTAALTPAERAALLAMLQRVSASLGLSPGVHPRLAGRPD
jgi:DNA-binding MarR family transcriptional regulator